MIVTIQKIRQTHQILEKNRLGAELGSALLLRAMIGLKLWGGFVLISSAELD